MSYFVGAKEHFPGIGHIAFEGRGSQNPLSFKFYEPAKLVRGKTMREHLRFAVAYWHSFCGTGSDPFGPGTLVFPWDAAATPMDRARHQLDAVFEFATKAGIAVLLLPRPRHGAGGRDRRRSRSRTCRRWWRWRRSGRRPRA